MPWSDRVSAGGKKCTSRYEIDRAHRGKIRRRAKRKRGTAMIAFEEKKTSSRYEINRV